MTDIIQLMFLSIINVISHVVFMNINKSLTEIYIIMLCITRFSIIQQTFAAHTFCSVTEKYTRLFICIQRKKDNYNNSYKTVYSQTH